MSTRSFSKKEALKFGWRTFKDNPRLLVITFGLVLLLNFLPAFILLPLSNVLDSVSFIFVVISASVLTIIIGYLIGIGVINISLKLVDHKKVHMRDLVAKSKILGKYITVSILYALITIVGFLLLIIPGIYLAIKYYFCYYLVIDKNMSPIQAIKRSGEITKGHKWNLLMLILILALINMVAGFPSIYVVETSPIWVEMLLSAGLLVSMPVSYLAIAHVYRTLEKKA